jgi:hypothetical protein
VASRAPDLTIEPTGGDFILTPITPAGTRWLDIQAEAQGWAREDEAAIVRGLPDARRLVEAILDAGLMIADTIRPAGRPSRTESGEWLH